MILGGIEVKLIYLNSLNIRSEIFRRSLRSNKREETFNRIFYGFLKWLKTMTQNSCNKGQSPVFRNMNLLQQSDWFSAYQ